MWAVLQGFVSRMSMDPALARRLFTEGGVLIVEEMPVGTEIGIDCNSWRTAERFRGVKMIPTGLHYIYYSAVDRHGQTAPRTGFFCVMKKRQIIVKRWNRTTEDLDDVVKSEEEIERLRAGLKDIDKNLGAYPYESLKKWVGLTQHISQSVLESLEPVSKNICSISQIESEETRSVRDEGTLTSECGSSLLPTAHASSSSSVQSDVTVQESQLRLSRVPDRKFPADATPEEVTRHSMDHSYALSCMMRDYYGNDIKNLLGELQFCFVCFLIGHVYSAFEQWKCLIHLLCSCDEAITTNPDLFMKLINTLHFQINEIPEDFFVDIVSRTNFLTTTLQMFFSTLEESTTVDSQLRKRGLQFRKHLTKKFKWDFTQPPDDCQPVIVDV